MRSQTLRALLAVLLLSPLLAPFAAPGALAQNSDATNPATNSATSPMVTPTSVVPHLIRYSGSLPDAPAAASVVQVKFALYAEQTGGEALWSEQQQVALDPASKYSVLLGSTSEAGLPHDLFATGQARWLGVTLEGAAESPRTLLVAAPYSLKASDAETLGGHPASDFALVARDSNGKPNTLTDITTITGTNGVLVNNTTNGSGTGPTVALALDLSYVTTLGNSAYAQLNAANTFHGNQTVVGNYISTGALTTNGTTSKLAGGGGVDISYANGIYTFALDAPTATSFGNALWAQLSAANTFSKTQTFSVPVVFASSQTFPGTATLAGNNTFAGTNTFSNPVSFASSQTFPGTATLAGNNVFAGTNTFSNPVSFASNQSFPGTVSLSGTNAFTGSNSFSTPVTFASTQTFPNTISSATGGGGIFTSLAGGALTIGINPATLESTYNTVYPQLNAANIFNGNQTIYEGNFEVNSGYIDVASTTSATNGTYAIGGAPVLHQFGGATNVFSGYQSGNFSLSGTSNTASGYDTLNDLTSGAQNTAIGAYALSYMTTGTDNVAIGYQAGENNIAGSSNTYLGYAAGPTGSTSGLTNSTAIGANAVVSESNALVLGGTDSNAVSVGIGTATPAYTLDVHGTGNFTGVVNFASAQTFPGVPSTSASNTFTGTQTFNSSSGTGISVTDTTASGSAVYAVDTASGGIGVNGQGAGEGVFGLGEASSSNSIGVYGTSIATTGTGVYGNATSGNGVYGTATSGDGVYGNSSTGTGVYGVTGAGTSAAGVYGSSTGTSGYGVYGTAQSTNGVGVYGTSNSSTGTGVIGNGSFGGYFSSTYTGTTFSPTGVYGYVASSNTSTVDQIGVAGDATNATYGIGVYGTGGGTGVEGTGTVGVLGQSTNGFGVVGSSSSASLDGVSGSNTDPTSYGAGVRGYSLSDKGYGVYGFDVAPSATGASFGYGTSSGAGAAVWADTNQSLEENVIAFLATADNTAAAQFLNDSAADATIVASNSGGGPTGDLAPVITATGRAGACGINTGGDVRCTGRLSTAVPLADKSQQVAVYAVQSSENWFEDFGSGTLAAGKATVAIDPTFAQIVNTGVEYHVFLTPKGDSHGLYVQNEGPTSFEVRESGGGTSTIGFDYRIVVKRNGHETERLADVTAEMQRMTAPRDRMEQRRAANPPNAWKTAAPAPMQHAVPRFHRPDARAIAVHEVPQP